MRWHDQLTDRDRAGRLPGLDDAVVRTFDAPEALEARFHEVHAKSALNRVPGGAKLPFAWTVNTYRGCLHSCSYCLSGDTLVLMGDGRTRPIAELWPGDTIYGTVKHGRHRRFVRTRVLDHWSTIKQAFKVTLADGTVLVASGDHRFLSDRGWKHVTGAMGGAEQRPYLTPNNSLIGTGGCRTRRPVESFDYQRGYLCGLIRGDGHLKEYWYPGRGKGVPQRMQGFRLALADEEALQRAELYLANVHVALNERVFSVATAGHRHMTSMGTGKRVTLELIRQMIRWRVDPPDDWRKGFLAGIFDAEGSRSCGVFRISNTDTGILAWTESCLRHFGFDVTVEDPPRDNGLRVLRVRGGLREHLRFYHLTAPAITRKWDIEGRAIKSDADLRVVSIEPLPGAQRLYDITTGTGDFIANGVVSHNCFARPTHEYLDLDAGRDFEKQIVVKVNAPEVLRVELRRPSWRGEHVALGTNTDPYQWVEKRYGLTRAVLEVLRDARNPCSVLTKSPLLLRDLDVFLELLEVTEFSACLSIPTLDERAWRSTEPHTPHPRKRIEAVAKLNAAGVPTGVLVAPLMPGINDAPEQVAAVVDACREAGATRVGGQALFLRGSTKDVFMGHLRAQRPDLVAEYERLYGRRAYLPDAEKRRVEAPLRRLAQRYVPELAERFQRCSERAPDGGPAGAERRFRGYSLATASAAEVATGRGVRRDAGGADRDAGAAARRARPARQEALF